MSNQDYRRNEMIINLRDIIWNLLEQWKAIAIVMIVSAALLVSFAYVRFRAVDEAKAEKQLDTEQQSSIAAEDRIAEVMESLSEADLASVNYTLEQKEWAKRQNEYLSNSIFLNENPTNQRTLYLGYSIEDLSGGNQSSLIYAYRKAMRSDKVLDALGEQIDPKKERIYISELIREDEEAGYDSNTESNTVTFGTKIVIPEEGDAKAIQEAVTTALIGMQAEIEKQVGNHNIRLISATETRAFNETAVSIKNTFNFNLNNIQNNIKNQDASLSDEARAAMAVIEGIRENEDGMVANDTTNDNLGNQEDAKNENTGINAYKKYVVAGALLGAMAYLFICFLVIIIKRRLGNASDIAYYTGKRLLGEVYEDGAFKGLTKLFHSRFVNSIRYKGKLDFQKQIEKAAKTINAVCKHDNVGDITAFDIANRKLDTKTIDSICSKLEGQKLNIDVISDAHEFDEDIFNNIKNVIFVMSERTKLSDVEKMIEICDEYNINRLGSVFIGEV